MAISNLVERTIDIDAGIMHEDLRRLFAVADAQAHTFRITVTSKGAPQDLSGHTVVGYFMTNYHGTVVITGSVSGSTATLVLPATCYAYNTGFQLIIRLVSGSTKTAVYWGSGYVTRSATSPEIDPGGVVPDLDDLLAKLDEMEAAKTAANTAAANANEAASKSIRYDVAQSLTSAQKTQAKNNIGLLIDNTLTLQGAAADAKKTGDEIADLKEDLSKIIPGLSTEAKKALLNCFSHIVWSSGNGEYYYNNLVVALNINSFEIAEYRYGGYGFSSSVSSPSGYILSTNTLENRAGSVIAIDCHLGGKLIAKTGYLINCYWLTGNEKTPIIISGTEQMLYYQVLYTDSSMYGFENQKIIPEGANYCCLTIKKNDNSNFTRPEILSMYDTAFEYIKNE